MRDLKLILATVLVISALIAGEAYIYLFDQNATYSVNVTADPGNLDYSLKSSIATEYDLVVIDNGTFAPNRECYIYYDSEYGSTAKEIRHATGGKPLTQDYYVSQLKLQLENRGVTATVLNAQELAEKLSSDATHDNALISVSGALPDTVYDGTAGSPVLDWIDAGGRLYWAGDLLGKNIAKKGEIIPAPAGYQSLFLDSECLCGDSIKGYSEVNNEWKDMLSFQSNNLAYGVNTSMLTAPYLNAGFSDGTYSSITAVKHGSGMICIVAGDYTDAQRNDLAQVVSSNLTYCSEKAFYQHGNITRETIKDRTELSITGNISAYGYFGGVYLVYGRCVNLQI